MTSLASADAIGYEFVTGVGVIGVYSLTAWWDGALPGRRLFNHSFVLGDPVCCSVVMVGLAARFARRNY
jgi:hypothetical protein